MCRVDGSFSSGMQKALTWKHTHTFKKHSNPNRFFAKCHCWLWTPVYIEWWWYHGGRHNYIDATGWPYKITLVPCIASTYILFTVYRKYLPSYIYIYIYIYKSPSYGAHCQSNHRNPAIGKNTGLFRPEPRPLPCNWSRISARTRGVGGPLWENLGKN